MWTVVYMSKNEEDINLVVEKLHENEVISKKRKTDDFYEILVPEAELSLAHNIIIEVEI